jgi:hypothetical protein
MILVAMLFGRMVLLLKLVTSEREFDLIGLLLVLPPYIVKTATTSRVRAHQEVTNPVRLLRVVCLSITRAMKGKGSQITKCIVLLYSRV